jgi:hypothetical protein
MMFGNNTIGSGRFDGCFGDVASPWLSCDFGVARDGVVAVAEQFGDKGRRRRHDEALQGGISRACRSMPSRPSLSMLSLG